MNLNPYQPPGERITPAELVDPPAQRSEIARLERSIAWLWLSAVASWIVTGFAILFAYISISRVYSAIWEVNRRVWEMYP